MKKQNPRPGLIRPGAQNSVTTSPWPFSCDAYRVAALREAGHRIHAGQPVDPGWLAAQLWDLADLLEAAHCD